MHPNGANKNKDDQAIFSKEGPNLISPELTNKPNVIPNIYKLKNNISKGKPNFKIETPNNGIAIRAAGTKPIIVLIKAEEVRANIISDIFKGDTNKVMIFLLQISSKKSILKLILDLKRIS